MATLTFLGAARTVTGSKYLLEHAGTRVLFDCGLFQGLKELRLRNWEDFPVPPDSIHAVVLTHAHLDHVGYLPRLVAQGFRGRVFCTGGTADLCRLVLPDSGRIQEEDARQANKHGYSKHAPALPLYTESDALRALTQLQPLGYNRRIEVAPGITVDVRACRATCSGRPMCSSRLAGGRDDPVRRRPRPLRPAGAARSRRRGRLPTSSSSNRPMAIAITSPDDNGEALAEVIRDTAGRGGKLIIPAFAIGRVEELLYWVRRLERERRIPVLPVYVDSPMAAEALRFYTARVAELDRTCGRRRRTCRRSRPRASRRSPRRSSRRS